VLDRPPSEIVAYLRTKGQKVSTIRRERESRKRLSREKQKGGGARGCREIDKINEAWEKSELARSNEGTKVSFDPRPKKRRGMVKTDGTHQHEGGKGD